ncbi:polymeric immunoglobulin receptor-like isoform X3 [Xyrichtys novacula]|nr:polymeric immunoglobulin receptor-like isoform X3 [Xyrichtys novacula]
MNMYTPQSLMLVLCLTLHRGSKAAEVTHVFGYEGKDVHVSCPYGEGYESYMKYLCKNDCSSDDVLITTGEDLHKYSIHDDTEKHVFTVTISNLSHTDAGKYWCMVSKFLTDLSTEVKLEVLTDSCCDGSTKLQSYEESSVSFRCPYVPKDQNNLKYLCRGKQPSTCLQQALITSDHQQKGRFNLSDNKQSREFTVTIASLTQKDSGSYLCGVQRNPRPDVFTAVDLEVKEWCCVESSELRGTVGDQVTMQCPYPPQHKNNRKFICKGDHRTSCADMMSQSRFSLQENVSLSSFSVRIIELKAEDAGTYWCGSDHQWRVGKYTKTYLSVAVPLNMMEYILPIGLALLTFLTMALVIVYRVRCYKKQGADVIMDGIAIPLDAVTHEENYENLQQNGQGTQRAEEIYWN